MRPSRRPIDCCQFRRRYNHSDDIVYQSPFRIPPGACMKFAFLKVCAALSLAAAALPSTFVVAQQGDPAQRQFAREVFQQLVEINTTDSVGNITTAAEAMQKRLLDAGFPAADMQVLGPNDRKKNLVI